MVEDNTSKAKYLIRYKRKSNTGREKEKDRNKGSKKNRNPKRKRKKEENHNPKIEASKQRTPIVWDSRDIVTHVVSLRPPPFLI